MRHKPILLLVVPVLLATIAGCGSSGGAGNSGVGNRTGVLTRADSNNYSQDAKILAARESSDGWIPSTVAKETDSDLDRIRSFAPQVKDIHARPLEDLDTVLVEVSRSAPWFSTWAGGNLTTGVAAIDSIGQTYRLTTVRQIATNGGYTTFKLSFADPLATRIVAAAYKQAGNGIHNADPNGRAGDGDNIIRSAAGASRVYAFSHGWGDCIAGCIQRHTWTFTLTSDGGISVIESGSPLP